MPLPRCLAIVLAAASACATPHGTAPSPARGSGTLAIGASAPREQSPDEQVRHVLDRLAFGGRPGDDASVRSLGVDRWIARQLAPERIDDRATDALVASSFPAYHASTAELLAATQTVRRAVREAARAEPGAANRDSTARRDVRATLLREDPSLRRTLVLARRAVPETQAVKLARAVASERQLQEVMTDFWQNHFSVYAGKGLTRLFVPAFDRDVIRPRALGRFRDLLGAVATSPAMLVYLEQAQSTVDSMHVPLRGHARATARRATRAVRGLNENYARELLELHTLGVDGGYTQRDVIEVARALTGWTIDPRDGGRFVFRPALHDAEAKIVLGHRLEAGRGIEDGEEVLDLLARSPATAHHLARKLAVRFVSDDPPPALVERAARTFLATGGDIRETLRTIVTSPEFFSRSAYRAKVKSPFELVASALRAAGSAPDTTPRAAQAVAKLGAPIFGHQAPDGRPETGEAWLNAGAMLERIDFGLAVAGGRVPGAPPADTPDVARRLGLVLGAPEFQRR
jgi:uncharacterized protein (DUF1800 family)